MLTGRDLHLAQVAHHAHDFVSSVAAAGFDLVLGFAPSLWDTDGPFHNRQQSFIADKVTLLLADAGVDVVPALAAYTARELRDFALATNDGKTTPLVWLDFQTAGKRAWPRVMAELRLAIAALPHSRFIAYGVGSRERQLQLLALEAVCSVVSSHEFFVAVRTARGDDSRALFKSEIEHHPLYVGGQTHRLARGR